MRDKPQNHVTRAMQFPADQGERGRGGGRVPDLTHQLLDALEERYPPRCLGTQETVEQHLRYAGVVAFIAQLRKEYSDTLEEQRLREIGSHGDLGTEDDINLNGAERA
jgi:hypothetical protein